MDARTCHAVWGNTHHSLKPVAKGWMPWACSFSHAASYSPIVLGRVLIPASAKSFLL